MIYSEVFYLHRDTHILQTENRVFRIPKMLPPDDFLRNLPTCLRAEDVFRFQTLVFVSDIMESALSRLISNSLACWKWPPSDLVRIQLFQDSWTIVDQVHTARLVINSMTRLGRAPDTQAYLDDFETAHRMRNRMDHLNQNLANRAKSTSTLTPLLGVVSFIIPESTDLDETFCSGEIVGRVFALCSGFMGQTAVRLPFEELKIKHPLSALRLEAFEEFILLEEAVVRLRVLLQRISADIQLDLHTKARAQAAVSDQSYEQLMAPIPLVPGFTLRNIFKVDQSGNVQTKRPD